MLFLVIVLASKNYKVFATFFSLAQNLPRLVFLPMVPNSYSWYNLLDLKHNSRTHLWHVEHPQEPSHNQRLSGSSISDHSQNSAWTVPSTLGHILQNGLGSHELHSAPQGLVRCTARVIDLVAQGDVGKESLVSVDLLNGEDHGLHPTEGSEVKSVEQKFIYKETVSSSVQLSESLSNI